MLSAVISIPLFLIVCGIFFKVIIVGWVLEFDKEAKEQCQHETE